MSRRTELTLASLNNSLVNLQEAISLGNIRAVKNYMDKVNQHSETNYSELYLGELKDHQWLLLALADINNISVDEVITGESKSESYSDLDLGQLFKEADRIGTKYQNQELRDLNKNKLIGTLNEIREILSDAGELDLNSDLNLINCVRSVEKQYSSEIEYVGPSKENEAKHSPLFSEGDMAYLAVSKMFMILEDRINDNF